MTQMPLYLYHEHWQTLQRLLTKKKQLLVNFARCGLGFTQAASVFNTTFGFKALASLIASAMAYIKSSLDIAFTFITA